MTKTRMNKLLAIFLGVLMTIAFGTFVPQMRINALNMTYTPTNGFRNSKFYSQLCDVNLTSDQRANLVNVAKSQIGYHEGNNFEQYGGGSSGSDNVTEYNYWYYGQKHVKGNDKYPWCAVFVSWCAKQAGLSNIIPSFAGCGTGYNSTLPGAGEKTHLRNSGYIPQSGDIIFFNSSDYSPGHVGIVNYVSNGYVYTIEGNSSDKVNTVSYALSNTKIYGYAVPNYSNTVPDSPYPEYIDVNISAGTSNTPSKFSWAESKGANNYYLRIFNNTGTKEVISVWGTDGKLSWDLQLDSGEYTAQVGAISENNSDYVTWSGLKSFVVEATSIIGDINADGKFNISDVVILQKWLLAVPNTKIADWKAADLCEDDRLNVFDLCLMKRMLIEQD